jgi:hypothetical protein
MFSSPLPNSIGVVKHVLCVDKEKYRFSKEKEKDNYGMFRKHKFHNLMGISYFLVEILFPHLWKTQIYAPFLRP